MFWICSLYACVKNERCYTTKEKKTKKITLMNKKIQNDTQTGFFFIVICEIQYIVITVTLNYLYAEKIEKTQRDSKTYKIFVFLLFLLFIEMFFFLTLSRVEKK